MTLHRIWAFGIASLLSFAAANSATWPLVSPSGGEQGTGVIEKWNANGTSAGSFGSVNPIYYGGIPRYGPDNNLYVSTWQWYNGISGSNNRVQIARYTTSGATVAGDSSPIFYDTFNNAGSNADSFFDMAFSGRELYVADGNRTGNQRIIVFNIDNLGAGFTTLPNPGSERLPHGMAFADPDTLYVNTTTTSGFAHVLRYSRTASVWSLDSYDLSGYDNSPNGLQGLPEDIVFDSDGNLYLLAAKFGSTYLPRIIKLTPAEYAAGGNLAGTANQFDIVTDIGADATGLAIGPDGRIYVGTYDGSIISYALDGSDRQVFESGLVHPTHLDFFDPAPVPEPASLALVGLTLCCALRSRRV